MASHAKTKKIVRRQIYAIDIPFSKFYPYFFSQWLEAIDKTNGVVKISHLEL
jgi:hypothetical protein